MAHHDDEHVRWEDHEVEWTGSGFVLTVPVDDLKPKAASWLDGRLAERLRRVPDLKLDAVRVDADGIALRLFDLEELDVDALRGHVSSALGEADRAALEAEDAAEKFSRRLRQSLG